MTTHKKKSKPCKQCGSPVYDGMDHSWWAEDDEHGLHGGACYHQFFKSYEGVSLCENTHFIKFTDDGRPLEPVTRRDALNETKRLQNLCYIIIDELLKHDKYKAERFKHELES